MASWPPQRKIEFSRKGISQFTCRENPFPRSPEWPTSLQSRKSNKQIKENTSFLRGLAPWHNYKEFLGIPWAIKEFLSRGGIPKELLIYEGIPKWDISCLCLARKSSGISGILNEFLGEEFLEQWRNFSVNEEFLRNSRLRNLFTDEGFPLSWGIPKEFLKNYEKRIPSPGPQNGRLATRAKNQNFEKGNWWIFM